MDDGKGGKVAVIYMDLALDQPVAESLFGHLVSSARYGTITRGSNFKAGGNDAAKLIPSFMNAMGTDKTLRATVSCARQRDALEIQLGKV
jgi:hypothetical protein